MNNEFLEIAVLAAQRGSAVLQEWAHKITVKEKSRANLVTEEQMADAVEYGHEAIKALISLQEQLRAKVGKSKRVPYIERTWAANKLLFS